MQPTCCGRRGTTARTGRRSAPICPANTPGSRRRWQPLPEKDQAKRRGAIYSVAASFKNVDTIVGGNRRRPGVDHARSRQELEEHHSATADAVEQDHADQRIAFRRPDRVCVGEPVPHRRSASVYLSARMTAGRRGRRLRQGCRMTPPVRHRARRPGAQGLAVCGDRDGGVDVESTTATIGSRLQYNLPHTSMRDLEIKGNDLIVATHGRSFWILDDISALRQLDGVNDDPTLTDSRSRESAKVGHPQLWLFKPGEAYRVRRSTYTDTPIPPDEPARRKPAGWSGDRLRAPCFG